MKIMQKIIVPLKHGVFMKWSSRIQLLYEKSSNDVFFPQFRKFEPS